MEGMEDAEKALNKALEDRREAIEVKKQEIELMEAGLSQFPLRKSVVDGAYKELFRLEAKLEVDESLKKVLDMVKRKAG